MGRGFIARARSRWPGRGGRAALVLALLAALAAPGEARADSRSDYLIGLLGSSTSFRVRAQAALSLGQVEANETVVEALKTALGDEHPAVRASAASSLERLADPSALAALQALGRDADPAVRRAVASAIRALERVARTQPTRDTTPSRQVANARYYVGIGTPGATDPSIGEEEIARVRQLIVDEVGRLEGVLLAPDDEAPEAAQRVLRRRRLTGYFIDSSIVRLEVNEQGTRATVSVVLGTYPGRDMRAMLHGRALVPGVQSDAARSGAIRGAVGGALRRLGQAMEQSANR